MSPRSAQTDGAPESAHSPRPPRDDAWPLDRHVNRALLLTTGRGPVGGDRPRADGVLGLGSRAVGADDRPGNVDVRQLVIAVAYSLCGVDDLHWEIRGFKCSLFCRRVFGAAAVRETVGRVQAHLDTLGYAAQLRRPNLQRVLDAPPFGAAPTREDWLARSRAGALEPHADVFRAEQDRPLARPGAPRPGRPRLVGSRARGGVGRPGRPDTRRGVLFSRAPNTHYMRRRSGGQLLPRTKAHLIWSPRRYFADVQEWEWIERRFDPRRAFALPRSIAALIGPEPRVIADEVWAKLMWAGLNLTGEDLPLHANRGGHGTPWYPLELVRAITMMWLFSGLRTDEIMRLPVGAIRWQQQPDQAGEPTRLCLLDVPTNKTSTALTKPVDQLVGDAIETWEAARPAHPQVRRPQDRRAGRPAVLLPRRTAQLELSEPGARAAAMPQGRRAARGRPRRDHRASGAGDDRDPARQRQGPNEPVRAAGLARAQLPKLDAAYARITPVTLTKACTDAGYFARNVRTIEVLLERDAITNGQVATGRPFEFYDLGHGYCSTASSSGARTGWRAPAATSTCRSPPANRSCSKPKTASNGCWSRSRSPTTNGRPLRAMSTPSCG